MATYMFMESLEHICPSPRRSLIQGCLISGKTQADLCREESVVSFTSVARVQCGYLIMRLVHLTNLVTDNSRYMDTDCGIPCFLGLLLIPKNVQWVRKLKLRFPIFIMCRYFNPHVDIFLFYELDNIVDLEISSGCTEVVGLIHDNNTHVE